MRCPVRWNRPTPSRPCCKGTGISFQISGNTVTLVSGGGSSLQLGATTISGQALGLTTEDTGSYTTGATTTATKLPLTLRETPQSVTVVTRQQMDDRGVTERRRRVAQHPWRHDAEVRQ